MPHQVTLEHISVPSKWLVFWYKNGLFETNFLTQSLRFSFGVRFILLPPLTFCHSLCYYFVPYFILLHYIFLSFGTVFTIKKTLLEIDTHPS